MALGPDFATRTISVFLIGALPLLCLSSSKTEPPYISPRNGKMILKYIKRGLICHPHLIQSDAGFIPDIHSLCQEFGGYHTPGRGNNLFLYFLNAPELLLLFFFLFIPLSFLFSSFGHQTSSFSASAPFTLKKSPRFRTTTPRTCPERYHFTLNGIDCLSISPGNKNWLKMTVSSKDDAAHKINLVNGIEIPPLDLYPPTQ